MFTNRQQPTQQPQPIQQPNKKRQMMAYMDRRINQNRFRQPMRAMSNRPSPGMTTAARPTMGSRPGSTAPFMVQQQMAPSFQSTGQQVNFGSIKPMSGIQQPAMIAQMPAFGAMPPSVGDNFSPMNSVMQQSPFNIRNRF